MLALLVAFPVVAIMPETSAESSPAIEKEELVRKARGIQIPFVANDGQTDERVGFYANTFGGTVFVTKDGEIVYALPKSGDTEYGEIYRKGAREGDLIGNSKFETRNQKPEIKNPQSEITGVALKEQLVGAKIGGIRGEEKAVATVNYFKGNDPSLWKSGISTYGVVSLGEVYGGIEVKFKAYGDNVEKLFTVMPHADPAQIRLSLEGAKGVTVNGNGELEADTELGAVRFTKPVAYQEIDGTRVAVAVEYELYASQQVIHRKGAKNAKEGDLTGFKNLLGLGNEGGMDKLRLPLPLATTGGAGSGRPPMAGRRYAGGQCPPYMNPPPNPLQRGTTGGAVPLWRGMKGVENPSPTANTHSLTPAPRSPTPVVYGFKLAAYDRTLPLTIDPLLASTYLGGSRGDSGNSLAIDGSGNVYVAGYTAGLGFPTDTGAYDSSHYGRYDVFVSKFDRDLKNLLAATFLGGSSGDSGNSIAIDGSGNVYVAGDTQGEGFPTTTGAYNGSFHGGEYDVFVSKFDKDLKNLLASTFLGGSGCDRGYSLALGEGGNVYVTGWTLDSGFPTATGAFDTIPNGNSDVFVSKFDKDLKTLLASTFLGGSDMDYGYSLAIDGGGNVYVTGRTGSSGFPTTTEAYDISSNGFWDVFVSKFDKDLKCLLASTYLGGSNYGEGRSLAIDGAGNVYVTGETNGAGFPTTAGAYDGSHNGDRDVFVSKFDKDLKSLLASTFLGGSHNEGDNSLAIDTGGNVYVAGKTRGVGFPTTMGTYNGSFNGGDYDVFVSKFNSDLTCLLASTYLGGSNYDAGYSLAIDGIGNVYITGNAKAGFPTTAGAYDTSFNSDADVFVSKFDSALSEVLPASPLPVVTTDSATDVTSDSATLHGTANPIGLSTAAWFNYGITKGSYPGTSTIQNITMAGTHTASVTISGLTPSTAYYYRIAAQNGAGASYGSEKTFTTLQDATAPIGTITINNGTSYTNSGTVTVCLSATDGGGVAGYYLSESPAAPSATDSGWTPVAPSASYSASVPYTLGSGGNGGKTVYVWFKDFFGNVSTAASGSITLDTASPAVTITSPASGATHTATSETISLCGSASDGASGIGGVAWSNSKGGNGTATGTSSWSAPGVSISEGDNVITVTAWDGAGNTSTGTLTVSYITPTGTITINNGASHTNSSAVTVNLSATDRGGVTGYYLAEGSFFSQPSAPSATASGWASVAPAAAYTGTAAFTLSRDDGEKTVYAWYKNASERVFGKTKATITVDTKPPAATITTPASGAAGIATKKRIDLGGSVQDSSVDRVIWVNSLGGSGTATVEKSSFSNGTSTWSASGIYLSDGDNVITVTASDRAGNTATARLAVKYTAPDPTAPVGTIGSDNAVPTDAITAPAAGGDSR